MKDTFKAYLDQQKADNKYMTAPSKELLGEGIFANKKYDCYAVTLDFSSEYMTKALSNVLINEYKSASGAAGSSGTDPVKTLIELKPEEFNNKLKEKVIEILEEVARASKNLKTFFGLGKESSALAYIQTEGNDDGESTILKYIFFKASPRHPKAYAERFKDEIGRNSKISILKNGVDIVPETYYKEDITEKRKDKEFEKFFKPKDNKAELLNDNFTTSIVNNLQDNVKKYLTELAEKNEKGNLISVYSVPFKVDDKLINETARNTDNLDDFYTELAKKINDALVASLKQVSKIDDYVGFIPTKSYGFNLYFKDKDTASEFAEKINQEGEARVNERKRYENKMSKLYQLLGANSDLSSLSHPENSADQFLRGTLFARTHIADLIKEKFPSAEDQLVIYQYIVKYDEDELMKFLHHFNIDVENHEIRAAVKDKLQLVLENIQKVYSDELVSMSSEGTNLVFFFRKDAKIDGVRTRIAEAMSCEMNRIKVIKTALTKKEVDAFKSKLSDLEDLESFYKAVEKLNGETVKLIKGDITLDESAIKETVTDSYQDQVLNLLIGITKSAKEVEGFVGIIVAKSKGVIEVYFKDQESYTLGRKNILQENGKLIKSMPEQGSSVEIARVDAKKMNNIIQPDNIKDYFENILKQKNQEAAEEADKKAREFTYSIVIPFSVEKFIEKHNNDKIERLINAYGIKVPEPEQVRTESTAFKTLFKNSLLKSINMLNEEKINAKESATNRIILTLQMLKNDKDKTLEKYLAENDQGKSIFDYLIKYKWTYVVDDAIKTAITSNNFVDSKVIAENYKSEIRNDEQFIIHSTGKAQESLGKILRTNYSNIFSNIFIKDSTAVDLQHIELKPSKNFE